MTRALTLLDQAALDDGRDGYDHALTARYVQQAIDLLRLPREAAP